MKTYSIYWIKEEFACRYFQKNDILYRFINEYQSNKKRIDLQRQFQFITRTFFIDEWIKYIEKNYNKKMLVKINKRVITFLDKDSSVSLHIAKDALKFHCECLHDAEKLLFPILRQIEPNLFIIGEDTENYGWISPVSMEKLHKTRQVLYSYI